MKLARIGISIILIFFIYFIIEILPQPGFSFLQTDVASIPEKISNKNVLASTYTRSSCVTDIKHPPTGVNMGNLDDKLSASVYIDYVFEDGNYYGFMANNWPGKLLRLDFGNSLLNTPTVTDLGTVGGVIPNNTEGVQIVKNENKWYVIVVGGDPVGGTKSRIVKVELGANIANDNPVGKNWGNIGNLLYPHDLFVFEDKGQWYGLTVNTDNNTITRFNFTSSFSNVPTAVNLGNIGKLSGPTGIYAMIEEGTWYAFVTNYRSNTLTRLNFGSSLLNTPVGTNLGNIGDDFHAVWDINIIQFNGENIGYAINAEREYSDIVKLDFGRSILNTPTSESFGDLGILDFPHSISKIFQEGSDLYSFIPNVGNYSLSRIRFTDCTKINKPEEDEIIIDVEDEPILLSPDNNENRASLAKKPLQLYTSCLGQAYKIGSANQSATYLWSTGATTDSIIVTSPGTYWIESTRSGSKVRDSIIISAFPSILNFSYTQDPCEPGKVQFQSGLADNASIQWSFGNGQVNSGTGSPGVFYYYPGTFSVQLSAINSRGCQDSITKTITIRESSFLVLAVK